MAALVAVLLPPLDAGPPPPARVVLITLDGARIEEVFGGLDEAVLRSTLAEDQTRAAHPLLERFGGATPEIRREKLMPFLWGTLLREHGSIAGNPAVGSHVRLSNRHRVSYPGYAELLLGAAHDDRIEGNDARHPPSPTALEFLRDRLRLTRTDVGVFASWSMFRWIAESRPGRLTINAGYEALDSPAPAVAPLSALQFETPTPWDSVRHDVYTFRFAMAHLEAHRPRVLYLALGETDDWAHDGRYERVLEAFHRSDRYLRELWTWLQADADYRGRTSLLVTTDHGRGRTSGDWRHHGTAHPDSAATWMAFVSPAWTMRGEWRDHEPLAAAQAAATLIDWMGIDWREFNPQAAPPAAFVAARD